jgi:hypothetical protein
MSQLERIIEHLLKLEHSRNAERRRQWMIAVNSARGEIARRMTPTIRNHVEPALPDLYRRSRRNGELALLDHGEPEAVRALPAGCPYGLDDLLADEWWPSNRYGLSEAL